MNARTRVTSAATADVCLVLEGTWPYVRGGVSGWVHQLILGLPEVTFNVLFIGGQRRAYGERRYTVPANVLRIDEVFLEDAWLERPGRRKAPKVAQADMDTLYRYFHHPEAPTAALGHQWLEAVVAGRLSLEAVRSSRASWNAATEDYLAHCEDPSFVSYFWTVRAMQAPLLLLAETARQLPRARMVHTVSTGYAGLVASLLGQRWGCGSVLSEHGIYTKERKIDLAQASWIAESSDQALNVALASGHSYIRTLWIRFFERIGSLVYDHTDHIIALYEGNRQRQLQDGARAERTRLIPNGIDLPQWASALEQRAPGIAPVVGLIGRVVPIKDVKTYLRALRGVINARPEVQGWIVGPEDEDPEYVAECRSLVISLGLEGKVLFRGFQRIQEILPQLGLMVLTSISEAQPLVILEAWAAGTPVVSSDVGSCREMIEGVGSEDRALGVAGEVVPIADPQATAGAILALLGDAPRWHQAQATGLARVRRYYTEALMLDQYRQLYRTALEKP